VGSEHEAQAGASRTSLAASELEQELAASNARCLQLEAQMRAAQAEGREREKALEAALAGQRERQGRSAAGAVAAACRVMRWRLWGCTRGAELGALQSEERLLAQQLSAAKGLRREVELLERRLASVARAAAELAAARGVRAGGGGPTSERIRRDREVHRLGGAWRRSPGAR
jgi:hypothetical protein